MNLERVQTVLGALLNSPGGDARSEQELREILESRQLNLSYLQADFIRLIYNRLTRQLSLIQINEWQLFHSMLRHIFFTNIGVEQALTGLRNQLLQGTKEDLANAATLVELMLSIAIQNQKNEYAHYISDEEQAIVSEMISRLTDPATTIDSQQSSTLLAAVLMYTDPVALHEEHKPGLEQHAADDNDVLGFFNSSLDTYRHEISVAESFHAQSDLADETSIKVADMYRDNPYPRWTDILSSMNINSLPLESLTGVEQAPAYLAPDSPVSTILVAGCGTGKHPIQLALNYPWIKITAIDISYRSIAYASIMAERHGVDNIQFKRCDILEAGKLQQQFDMIDCIGVLHHMEDPEKGLQSLLPLLNPKGLFRLALYSKIARQSISRFRDSLEQDLGTINNNDIRNIRHNIVAAHQNPDNTEFIKSHDFYSLSGCRDLLLHRQEIQYTVDMIRELLEPNGLTFLGPGMPMPQLAESIQATCGANASVHELANWEKVEQASPSHFSGMYKFFTQKTA